MLQALAQDAQGHQAQALAELFRAFTQAAEPDAYVRLFLDEGSPMTELLRAAARHGAAGAPARRLLRQGTLGAASGAGADANGGPGPASNLEPLSERELQVLQLLGRELSGPQIAGELFISYNTLRTHTRHIFSKLDVSDRRTAVRRAREAGLL
jgi:LuxR family maltose regulon positive regulatory protein